MLIIQLKNIIRSVLGRCSIVFEGKSKQSKIKLYCNLVLDRVDGGPNRFLRNLTNSKLVKENLLINNWSLRDCSSALVFSGSWGNSFGKICKKKSIKSVLRVDGFFVPEDEIDLNYQHSSKFQSQMNKRLAYDLKVFDHIIYQSHFSKEICDKYLFKRQTNFSIISNGTNLEHFKPHLNDKNEKLNLILVAKYYPKHLDLALKVFKQVLMKLDAEMTIVGPMRNGSDEVEEYVMRSPILSHEKSSISFKSFVQANELPKILSSHDIFLHVKVGDWCPNAVIEAMACGLPVVCPSWGGTKELIGDAGYSVEGPEWGVSEELIMGMMEAILKISKSLDTFKKNARQNALDNFSIEDVSKKYLKLLNLID